MTSPKRTHEYARQPNRESAIRITISVHTNATLFGPDSPAPRTSVQCSIGIAANVIGHENMKTLYWRLKIVEEDSEKRQSELGSKMILLWQVHILSGLSMGCMKVTFVDGVN